MKKTTHIAKKKRRERMLQKKILGEKMSVKMRVKDADSLMAHIYEDAGTTLSALFLL